MSSLAVLPILFIIAYLLLVRPQQRKARAQQKLMSDYQMGDKVVTAGGIVGIVVGMDDRVVELKLTDGVTVSFLRQAVNRRWDLMFPEPDLTPNSLGGSHPEDPDKATSAWGGEDKDMPANGWNGEDPPADGGRTTEGD
ncbi:MAG: preprotein translocase subunit YajC [Acidimicrobiales bacterium]